MLVRLALVVVVCLLVRVEASQELLLQMAKDFGKPLAHCKEEIGLPDNIMQELNNFWKESYVPTDRLIGCAILCMSTKLDLLDAELHLHHNKATAFAQKHGASEAQAKELVDMIHSCVQSTPVNEDDPCQKTLEVIACFKVKVHKLNWAPDIELLVGELIAEG